MCTMVDGVHPPGLRLIADRVGIVEIDAAKAAVSRRLSVALALVAPRASLGLYIVVAAIWLVPDRRMERVVLDCENGVGAGCDEGSGGSGGEPHA